MLTVIRIINNLRSHVYRNGFFDLELVIQYENHLPYIVCGYKENSTQYLKLEDLLYLENSDQINIKFFNKFLRVIILYLNQSFYFNSIRTLDYFLDELNFNFEDDIDSNLELLSFKYGLPDVPVKPEEPEVKKKKKSSYASNNRDDSLLLGPSKHIAKGEYRK